MQIILALSFFEKIPEVRIASSWRWQIHPFSESTGESTDLVEDNTIE